jgi:sialate O-acetylesterase
MIRTSLVTAALLTAVSSPALAAPQLSPVWSDHAVVQRDQPIRVEGTAARGERISATFGEQTATVRADAQGRFTLEFPARPATGDSLTLTVTGADGSAVTVSDILVGDVWLCSGQSNMEWPLSASVGGAGAAQASADNGLRLLLVPKDTAAAPQSAFSTPTPWALASAESAPPFSAACYYMARQLRRDLEVPIGAINSNWGGSQMRAWLSPEAGAKLYGAERIRLRPSPSLHRAGKPGGARAQAGKSRGRTPTSSSGSPSPRSLPGPAGRAPDWPKIPSATSGSGIP